MDYSIIIPCLLTLIFFWLYKRRNNTKLLLPGPWKLPVIGNAHQLLREPRQTLSTWARKYGELYQIQVGPKTVVCLSSAKTMREVLGNSSASGIYCFDFVRMVTKDSYGMVGTKGQQWLELRQFFNQNLKNIGYKGDAVLEEVKEFITWITSPTKLSHGVPNTDTFSKNLNEVLHLHANSSLWSLISGKKGQPDHTQLHCLLKNFYETFTAITRTGVVFFPQIRHFLGEQSGYNAFSRAVNDVHSFIKTEFDNHVETYQKGRNRDLMDFFIERMKNTEDESSAFYGEVGYTNAIHTFIELFLAGPENLANTILWSLICLALHPKVQRRLQEEIDNALGEDEPTLSRKSELPYLDAVVLETFRFSSVVQIGVPHEAANEIHYKQHIFPRGTIFLPNIYHVHHDPMTWTSPEKFRPERFLSNENVHLRKSVVTFQGGSRGCPGGQIARDALFLYICKICQRFEILPDDNISREEYLTPKPGYLLHPGNHKLNFKNRL